MEQTFKVDGHEYCSLPGCSVGDYSGDGTIGRANIDAIKEDYFSIDVGYDILRPDYTYGFDREATKIREEEFPPLVVVNGDFGYEQLFMDTEHTAFDDLYERLENYPVYDDQARDDQEREDKESNWDSWMRSDFLDTIRKAFGDDEAGYELFEAEFDNLNFGVFQVESWLCTEFNLYIEEDGFQSYTMDFDRLLNYLRNTHDNDNSVAVRALMNEFLDKYQ